MVGMMEQKVLREILNNLTLSPMGICELEVREGLASNSFFCSHTGVGSTTPRLTANHILDFGLWTLDFGLWTLDFGLWTLDFGLWTWDLGL